MSMSTRTAFAAAAVALVLIGASLGCASGEDAAPTEQAPVATEASENAANARAVEVATGFLEAYGAFDLERAMAYLADDAPVASLGELDDPRLLIPWLEATGYEQVLGSCEAVGASSSAGTTVSCPYRFHALRSSEIGRGPFGGSSFELVVRDGEILRLSQDWETEKFSPQVWDPFADWVSRAHPKDVAVMYEDAGQSGVRLTEESIRLWELRTREYVEDVGR